MEEKEERDNIKLLIKIILYIFLAIAFFSNYAAKDNINFIIATTFLFGILALICLYLGLSLSNHIFKKFGCVFAGSFILVFSWFILNVLIPMESGTIIKNSLSLLKAQTIWIGLLIPLICLVICIIVKTIKTK